MWCLCGVVVYLVAVYLIFWRLGWDVLKHEQVKPRGRD